jgi:ribosomal protein S12 methylthiotransferase
MRELPEVDAILGVGSYTDVVAAVDAALARTADHPVCMAPAATAALDGARARLTPPYWAWLRIAEGCDNRCAYCAIPDIRGPFRSRPMDSIVAEAETLAAEGAREIILIAQDTTRYGLDIYGHLALEELLARLEQVDGVHWIRVHYLYPDELSDALLARFAGSRKILPYFDIPIQHIADPVLKSMHRRGDGVLIRRRIDDIRRLCPDAVIRTSLIAGFPGETEADFLELCAFLRQYRLERVGIFCYSQEDGTPAAALPGQIDEATKQRRQAELYAIQEAVMAEKSAARVGQTLEALCCGVDAEGRGWGRTYMDSPDIDGVIYFEGGAEGAIYPVAITHADGPDLFGVIV